MNEEEKYNIRKVITSFLKEHNREVVAYLLLSLAFPISNVLLPHYYGKIINKTGSVAPKDVFKANSKEMVTVVGLWALDQVLYTGIDRLDEVFLPKLQSYVRTHIVERVIHSFKGNYSDLKLGEILTKVLKLPNIVRHIFSSIRSEVLPTVMVFLAVVGYFMYVHPILGTVVLISGAVYCVMLYNFATRCVNTSENYEQMSAKLHGEIEDVLSNLLNVYGGNNITSELERIEKITEEHDVEYRSTIKCTTLFKRKFSGTYFTFFCLINGIAMYLYSKGMIAQQYISSVLIISLYLINQLSTVSHSIRSMVYDFGTLKQVQSYLDELKVSSPPDGVEEYRVPNDGVRGDIRIDAQGKNDKIVCHITPRSCVLVTGQIGAGKTTLIKSILKMRPYSGSIQIDGQELRDINGDSHRGRCVYIPQNPRLFNRSVLENIVYGTSASRRDVEGLIDTTGVRNFFSENLDKECGKNGDKVSGGQRQIIHLLRAMLSPEKDIVILDEPTASLDGPTKNAVVRMLSTLAKNRTTLIISHDPEVRRVCNKSLEL